MCPHKLKQSLERLQDIINQKLTAYPDAAIIVAGDFNHANLRSVLPKFFDNVRLTTRGENILDQVYTNISNAYKVSPSQNLGLSDNLSVFLSQSSKPLISRIKPEIKTVQVWREDSISALQNCFENSELGHICTGS